MSTRSFPGVKSGQGMTLNPHPLPVPWSWKGRAIPLLPLWAVRPVQSLSACTRVQFTLFTLSSVINAEHILCFWSIKLYLREQNVSSLNYNAWDKYNIISVVLICRAKQKLRTSLATSWPSCALLLTANKSNVWIIELGCCRNTGCKRKPNAGG
jgi:hypothetical protein